MHVEAGVVARRTLRCGLLLLWLGAPLATAAAAVVLDAGTPAAAADAALTAAGDEEGAPFALPPEVQTPATPRVGDTAPDPLRSWSGTGELRERAERARLAALQLGATGFDALGRGLVLAPPEGDALASAEAAALAAPDLPLAQAALAGERLGSDHDLSGALQSAYEAVSSLGRHPEARPWLEALGLFSVRQAVLFGALAFLLGLAAVHAPAAAHDLGDRSARSLPSFARAALLGVLVLLPSILGQGLLGLALSCFVLALCYGDTTERRAAWAAAGLLVFALEAGTLATARALLVVDPDPVASAAQRVESGIPSPVERARLEAAAPGDPTAARGLAALARRDGRLVEAAQRYEALLATNPRDGSLANNAANVGLALGDVDRAVALYEIAAQLDGSPVVLYNLSYGYGQTIRPRAQDETLQRLQRVAPALAYELTQLQAKLAGGFTVDLPLSAASLRARSARAGRVVTLAADLRRDVAPGILGASLPAALGAFLVFGGLARAFSGRFRHSRACARCGDRLCPRCDESAPTRGLCGSCYRLFERPETANPERRAGRLAELERRARWRTRARLAAGIVIPGAAGTLARRPWLGLTGAIALAAVASLALSSRAPVVDPLAAGLAGTWVIGLAGAASLLVAALCIALAQKPRRAAAP